jgi:hypothetical protein
MAVTILQRPTVKFDQAYGPNPVTLTGLTTSEDKYVLQILAADNITILADVRQSPNKIGNAIFDIQNILQSFARPSIPNIEQTGYIGTDMVTAPNEVLQYKLRYGSETNGTINYLTTDNFFQYAFGGKKKYYEIPYDPSNWIPKVVGLGACTDVERLGMALSDNTKRISYNDIADGKPGFLIGQDIWVRDVTREDMTTISFYNGVVNGTPVAPTSAKGIDRFRVMQYNGNTLIADNTYNNTLINGGGPNTVFAEGITPFGQYQAITFGTGPVNYQDFDPNATHYYVITEINGGDPLCAATQLHYAQRFNVTDTTCNDYPEIQFSWLNGLGFRDYFSFLKKNDRNVNIKRNTYLKNSNDWNGQVYDVDIFDRGYTVYSQTLEETYTATTGFLSDEEAKYLESLFISPDVRVRMNAQDPTQWKPVILLSAQYVEKTARKNKLFQYEIQFKISHNIKSQRG